MCFERCTHISKQQRKGSKSNTQRKGKEGVLFPFWHQGKSYFLLVFALSLLGNEGTAKNALRESYLGEQLPKPGAGRAPVVQAPGPFFLLAGCSTSRATGQSQGGCLLSLTNTLLDPGSHGFLSSSPPPSLSLKPTVFLRWSHLGNTKPFLFLSHQNPQIVQEGVTRSWGTELKNPNSWYLLQTD